MVAYTYYSSDPRVRKEAECLAENGFEVDFFSLRRPGEPGFQSSNGINLYRVNCSHYKGKSNFRYLLSYLFFFMMVSFRLSFLHLKKRYLIIHINNMPDFLVFCALIPKLSGSKIILDIHDVMSDVFFKRGEAKESSFIEKILIMEERMSAKVADSIITVDDYCKKTLINHGIDAKKISVVSNFPDENLFKPVERKKRDDNEFNLFFHGTISKIYGLDTVLQGIRLVCEKIPELRFTIMGEGNNEEEISGLIKTLGLERVVVFKNKKIPQSMVPDAIKDADLGVVSYSGLNTIFSNKFLEYIAMGIPVIMAYNEQVYNYFKDYNLEFYERNNPDSFAQKIYYLYSDKKRYNELKKISLELGKKFKWGVEKEKYISLVNSLIQ